MPRAAPSCPLNRALRLSPLETLNKPSQFRAVRDKGASWHTTGFILSALRPAEEQGPSHRLGLILTKKTGNAVKRNRIKRRLRALARDILPKEALPADYVLIGKTACIDAPAETLRKDMLWALKKLSLTGSSSPQASS